MILDVVCIIFASLFLQCTAGEQYEMKKQLLDNIQVEKQHLDTSLVTRPHDTLVSDSWVTNYTNAVMVSGYCFAYVPAYDDIKVIILATKYKGVGEYLY